MYFPIKGYVFDRFSITHIKKKRLHYCLNYVSRRYWDFKFLILKCTLPFAKLLQGSIF